MKKLLFAFIAVILALTLLACTEKNDQQQTEDTAKQTDTYAQSTDTEQQDARTVFDVVGKLGTVSGEVRTNTLAVDNGTEFEFIQAADNEIDDIPCVLSQTFRGNCRMTGNSVVCEPLTALFQVTFESDADKTAALEAVRQMDLSEPEMDFYIKVCSETGYTANITELKNDNPLEFDIETEINFRTDGSKAYLTYEKTLSGEKCRTEYTSDGNVKTRSRYDADGNLVGLIDSYEYYEDGSLKSEARLDGNNNTVYKKAYSESGKLQSESEYDEGSGVLEEREYSEETGKIIKRTVYGSDSTRPEAIYEYNYENGVLKSVSKYDGYHHFIEETLYDENGDPIIVETYKVFGYLEFNTPADAQLEVTGGKTFLLTESVETTVGGYPVTATKTYSGTCYMSDGKLICSNEVYGARIKLKDITKYTEIMQAMRALKSSGDITEEYYQFVVDAFTTGYTVRLDELEGNNPAEVEPILKYAFRIEDGTAIPDTEWDNEGNVSHLEYFDDGNIKYVETITSNGEKIQIGYNEDGSIDWIKTYDSNGNLIVDTSMEEEESGKTVRYSVIDKTQDSSELDDIYVEITGNTFSFTSITKKSSGGINFEIEKTYDGVCDISDDKVTCECRTLLLRATFENAAHKNYILASLENSRKDGSVSAAEYEYLYKLYSGEGYIVKISDLRDSNPIQMIAAEAYQFTINGDTAYVTYYSDNKDDAMLIEYYYSTGNYKSIIIKRSTGETTYASFYENGNLKMRKKTGADGTTLEETYFDENGNIITG